MANDKDNVTTKFKVDISDLKKEFTEARRQIQLANSEFKAATGGMDDWTKSADGLSAKLKQLKDVLSAQKTQLKSLEEQYALVVKEQGADSKGAEDLMIKINNQKAAIGNTEKQIRNYNTQLETLGTDTTEATKDTSKLSDGFTVMKGVLADLVSTGIKALIDGLKDVAKAANEAYKEFDAGYDTLIKATGATGDSAKAIEESYKNVAKSVKGDMSDIGAAVGEVNTRFGYTGEQLEKLSGRFLKFADINSTDVVTAVDNSQKAMSAYGLSFDEAEHYLDLLTKTAQDTGVSTDKLNTGIISNATAFKEMGLNIDQAVSFMGQLEKSGANSETVLNGMRKALKNSAENGLDLNAALLELQKSIENDTDSTGALTAAYDLFGKSGDQIYGAIKNGTLSFEELTRASGDVTGAVDNTYAQTQDAFDKISLAAQGLKTDIATAFKGVLNEYAPEIDAVVQKVKKSAADAFSYFIKDVLPVVRSGIEWVIDNLPTIEALIVGIGAAFAAWKVVGIVTAVTTALQGMTAAEVVLAAKQAILNTVMAANPIGLIVTAIAGLVAAFVVLWNKSDTFRQFWLDLWDSIQETVGDAIDTIKDVWASIWEVISPYVDAIKRGLSSAFDEIKEMFEAAWGVIKAVWDLVAPYFSALWDGIKETFSGVKDTLGGIFSAAWETIKAVWDVVVPYFKAIWENIKTAFSFVKDTLSRFFETAWTAIKAVWDNVVNYFKMIWDNIKLIFSAVKSVLSGDFSGAWNAIKGIWDNVTGYFSGVWDNVKKVFSSTISFFRDTFSKAWNAVKNVFSGVGSFFSNLWQIIVSKFTTIGTKIGDAIGGAFKTAINAVLATVEKAINAVPYAINNAIDLINELPGVDISPMSDIKLPRLARGGVLKRGQMGLLEGSGAEAVVPLEKNTRWLDEIASRIYSRMTVQASGGNAGALSQNVTNNFYQTNNSPKALSRLEIYRQSKNLLRMKGAV